MKQKFLWLLMALCAMTFAACGDDDDSAVPSVGPGAGSKVTLAQAVGTWQLTLEKTWKAADGMTWDVDTDTEPDRLVIKADGTFEFWDYDSETGTYHNEEVGNLDIENGYIVGNGFVRFTDASIVGNIMTIAYNRPDVDDGKACTKYYVTTFAKIG